MTPGSPEDDFKFEDLDASERRNDNDEVDETTKGEDAVPQSPITDRDREGQELPGMELDVVQGVPINVSSSVFAAPVPVCDCLGSGSLAAGSSPCSPPRFRWAVRPGLG